MAGSTVERPIRISIGRCLSQLDGMNEKLSWHYPLADRGGTFTDCVAIITGQEDIVIEILSVDPRNYPDAPTEAIRLVLERFYGKAIPRGTKLDLKDVGEYHGFPGQSCRCAGTFLGQAGILQLSRVGRHPRVPLRLHNSRDGHPGPSSGSRQDADSPGRTRLYRTHRRRQACDRRQPAAVP